jgi:hypothetical protein
MGDICSDFYRVGDPEPKMTVKFTPTYEPKPFMPEAPTIPEHVFKALEGTDKPDGGPAEYYDFPKDYNTLNDVIEWKGETSWLGDSFHLGNIVKAAWRWGIKSGTSKEYDARKFMYSGARLLMKYVGKEKLRETLQKMLDDKQFGGIK